MFKLLKHYKNLKMVKKGIVALEKEYAVVPINLYLEFVKSWQEKPIVFKYYGKDQIEYKGTRYIKL